jgi:hypothetical protein
VSEFCSACGRAVRLCVAGIAVVVIWWWWWWWWWLRSSTCSTTCMASLQCEVGTMVLHASPQPLPHLHVRTKVPPASLSNHRPSFGQPPRGSADRSHAHFPLLRSSATPSESSGPCVGQDSKMCWAGHQRVTFSASWLGGRLNAAPVHDVAAQHSYPGAKRKKLSSWSVATHLLSTVAVFLPL